MNHSPETITHDTYNPELSYRPPNMRVTIALLHAQRHGTKFYIGYQNEIIATNSQDNIHVPTSAITAIHRLTWKQNDNIPIGMPGHCEPTDMTLV